MALMVTTVMLAKVEYMIQICSNRCEARALPNLNRKNASKLKKAPIFVQNNCAGN